jgi:nucleotide-binding universal stress UspA family protein
LQALDLHQCRTIDDGLLINSKIWRSLALFRPKSLNSRVIEMTTKILCATDGGAHFEIAVTLAAQLASKLGAKLSIIAVNILVADARGGTSNLWTDEKLNEVVGQAIKKAKTAGALTAEAIKAFGRDPAAVIIDYAEKNGFDHIVVGSPRVGVARLVLGSVAAEVAAKAHCPVTVAR